MSAGNGDELQVKYVKYLVLILGGVSVFTLIFLVLIDTSSEYIPITNDTRISSRIKNVNPNHGTLYIDFEDSSRYKINSITRNHKYTPADILSFANGGDWIEKMGGSDTLIIERSIGMGQREIYIFVIGKELNK